MKDPKDIADKYFEIYSKLTDSTSRIALIALLVLVTNWLFIVESNFDKYTSVKQEFQYKFQAIENQFVEINQKYSEDTATYKIKRQELVAQKDELTKEKENSLKDKLTEVKDLPSLIKFIFFISDNLEKGGLILNILFFTLLTYLLFNRRTSLQYLSKAIRIYKIEPTLQINAYQDFNLSSPIWLAPLPKNQNKDVSPAELKTILGWTFNHSLLKIGLIATLIAIVIIQSRLAFITFIVNGSKFNSIFFLSSFFVMLTSLLIIYWLLPIKIEDNFNYEKNPNPFSRRDFITVSSFTILSIVLFKFSPLLPKYIHKRVPRFRANKIKFPFTISNFKSSLVKNKKSNIVHYINSQGFSQTLQTISSSDDFNKFKGHIEKFNQIATLKTKHEKPRMPIKHSTWHSENLAFESIQIGNFTVAFDIILYAIKQGIDNYSPSYRLHDLLALLCVRYKTKIPNGVFENLVELSNNSKDKKLIERAKKWNDNKWIDKICKKTKVTFNKITI
ncbi:hypothetical protein [Pedobacter mendelii]|uniref:Uncharacterized protein n=1 Tax=Pedobacter mendelii TaxID=1908240 RepID=A0ABQ2BM03_9SPHI|nr:hypothetical protein [Pedobacter mendelii]GGI29372.1 hypothetical protein GCM10008119_37300 [Pedobacter mendelii]